MRCVIWGMNLLGVAVALGACLSAPNEPTETSHDPLTCDPGTRRYNGVCRKICVRTADCEAGLKCMDVGYDALCLDYQHCAHLGSDTVCTRVQREGAGESDCVGDATWQVRPASGDPQCGEWLVVSRCRRWNDECSLSSGPTSDIAEP